MTPEHSAPLRRGWLTVNLVAQLAFGLLAMTICLPSMQQWPAEFGVSQARVQLSFSLFVAAFGGMQLIFGAVSDRIGRKPVLMTGLVMAFAGLVMAALATDMAWITAARTLQGAGCAAGMVLGRAMVQDLFVGPERTRVLAFVGMSMGMCPPLAMVVGGQVHVLLGWRANFWIMAAMAVLLMAAAWFGLPSPRRAKEAPGAAAPPHRSAIAALLAGYARLAREPVFLLYAFILATTAATFYAYVGGAPIVLAGYGVGPDRMGWYLMCIPVSYVAGNALSTRLIPRFGEQPVMMAGHVGAVAGIVLVLAFGLAGHHTALALSVPMLLMGLGQGLLMPPTLSGTVGLVPALAGTAAAMAGLTQQMTGALGGFAVGLVPHNGPVNLALQVMAWSVASLVAQLALVRYIRRRPAA